MAENLFKRNSFYWGCIIKDGVKHRRSLRTSDRAEARKRLEAWRKEIERASFYGESRHTWKEAVVKWTVEVMPKNVKAGTAKRYQTSLRMIDPHWNDLYVDQIDLKKIAAYVSTRTKAKATNATIRRDLTAASAVLGACVSWTWIETNPARAYDRNAVIKERREPMAIPSDDAIDRLVAACPGNLGKMVRFLAESGCRLEEAGGLEWSQIRQFGIVLTKTKTNRVRTINLATPGQTAPDTLSDTLKSIPRYMNSPWVFWHSEGSRYLNLASRLKQISKREGVNFPHSIHSLRHAFAVRWLRNGGDIYALQQHLGHSSIKTTEIYLAYVPNADDTKSDTVAAVSDDR